MELKMMSGGSVTDTDELTAVPEKVLEDTLFIGNGNDEPQNGSMPDLSKAKDSPTIQEDGNAVPAHEATRAKAAVNSDGKVQVALSPPKGFFPGDGLSFVCCTPEELGISPENIPAGKTICLVSGTWGADADFTTADLKEGKVAYGPDGRQIGEAKDYGQVSKTVAAGETYDIKKGFYDDGKVTAKDLKSQTGGTATKDQILYGRTAWVNGTQVTGAMPNIVAIDPAKSIAHNGNSPDGILYFRMSPGAHVTNATSGYPEVSCTDKEAIKAMGLTVRGQYQYGGAAWCDTYFAVNALPEGIYYSNGASWAPEGRCTAEALRNALGIDQGILTTDQNIAGIQGLHKSIHPCSGWYILNTNVKFTATSWNISQDNPGTFMANLDPKNVGPWVILRIWIGSLDEQEYSCWVTIGTNTYRRITLRVGSGYAASTLNLFLVRKTNGDIYYTPVRGTASGTYSIRIKVLAGTDCDMSQWDD